MPHSSTDLEDIPPSLPWDAPSQLPPLDANVDLEGVSPLDIARQWFSAFSRALSADSPLEVTSLFADNSFYRDLLALSWDFRIIQNSAQINQYISSNASEAGLNSRSLTLLEDPLWAPSLHRPIPEYAFIQLSFTFETAVGKCRGTARLVPNSQSEWKAYTVFTALESLIAFPEKIGNNRDPHSYETTWEESRNAEVEFAKGDPPVVIIGGGHSGLEVAARLKALGTQSLVIERNPRIGDNWRNRYKSLRLHDTIWFDHLPYMPFPQTWPVYSPATKLAEWLESYATALDLNVWTSSTIQSARWDAEKRVWHLTIKRGEQTRELQSNHLVLAPGLNGSIPHVPQFPGQDVYQGQKLHSSQFKSAEAFVGKKVAIIGACNSAHDIARDCVHNGVNVTMIQRSSTCIISAQAVTRMVTGLYHEGGSTEYADHVSSASPWPVNFQLHKVIAPRMLQIPAEKEVIEGLERVGFKTNKGPHDAGIFPLVFSRAGGYYLNTGGSQEIIAGKIKVKNGSVETFTETGLRLSDGSELEADIVVFATGFQNPRDIVKDICGPEVHDKVQEVWGMNSEGELRSVWRPCGQEALWYALGNLSTSRIYSRFLALQIKAWEEGLLRPVT